MVRTRTVAACGLFAVVMAGCESAAPEMEISRDVERALLETQYEDARRAGVIRQQTIQPYHFVVYTATLNELGVREIEILATHYRIHGGVLRIRRGDAEEQLYQDRVEEIRSVLRARNVDMSRVRLSDGLPGGDGLASDRVVEMLVTEEQAEAGVFVDNPDVPHVGTPNIPIAD